MNPLSFLRYPAYVYNPRQILIRIRRSFYTPDDHEIIHLPWGHQIAVNPSDFIGRAIRSQGIHEIDVCEAVARLASRGDLVVDVGANIGFVTSLLARVTGPTGRVLAFEPHPDLFVRLRDNVERFSGSSSASVMTRQVALSDRDGEAFLTYDRDVFARNSGTAGLRNVGFACGDQNIRVQVDKLDSFISQKIVGLLKIDVEGAELNVLKGAQDALADRRIKSVVYEDFDAASSGIASYLKSFGFSVFHLDGTLFRPVLREVTTHFRQIPRGRDENFLAVLDPIKTTIAYAKRGWRTFSL